MPAEEKYAVKTVALTPDLAKALEEKGITKLRTIVEMIARAKRVTFVFDEGESVTFDTATEAKGKEVKSCYEKYVGYDGRSFYCKLCGKTGFKSVKAVVGHLNSCPARGNIPDALSGRKQARRPYKVTPEIVKYVKEKWPKAKAKKRECKRAWAILRSWVKGKFGIWLSHTTLRKIIEGKYDNLTEG